ncbi:MAG TPA: MaoC family dehydratase [Blastocatellia bacterium]|nr:MaoC family dehydratase [Blastocatellia bacterium]
MNQLTPGQELPAYTVIAHNYATGSENRIHSDEVAAQYGFAGGLVPGVGNYAYLTRPAVEALGRDWLARGAMKAKFLKPVYDGERVSARARVSSTDPLTLSLELYNSAGTLCAAGEASLPESVPPLDPAAYPACAPSEPLLPATITALPAGLTLGSLERQLNLAEMETGFVTEMRDALPLYRGPEAVCHPALLPALANEILMKNVALGPWIHTASEVQHYSLPGDGETLSLQGRIAESYERRGHEFVVLDLALFADAQRLVARIRHTAIVRLRA